MTRCMPDLPVEAALPELKDALARGGVAVLVAPPGAGKTTGVPLALIDEPWRRDGTILVLEPRRIAARGAAARMASVLGERTGQRVGLRARFDVRESRETRILVVTEGVFTRMILDDPSLSGIAAILFDEFHERSLDADFGLALALEVREALRPDLRILVMSATLDDRRVAALLGDAPVVRSEGRAYPVETRYRGRGANMPIEARMAEAILAAHRSEGDSILAFLPGQGEIERVARLIEAAGLPADTDLCPLYGALDVARQDEAIRPSPPGRRKIVLATSIAETSITIDGVRIVVDSGLSRVPRYEPDLGISRLETTRVSRASADQRRGRAGRTEPGIAIRLWDEAQDRGLVPFNRPEILDADLSGFRLDCAQWGAAPAALRLLDPPPVGALAEAEALLRTLDALDGEGRITARGRALRRLPLPPRLAALVIEGAERGEAEEAARLAALVGERGIGGHSIDLAARLDRLAAERTPRAEAVRQMAARWARLAIDSAGAVRKEPAGAAGLVALAFRDRIGKPRGEGTFSLANGRIAWVAPADVLAKAEMIVVADMTGSAARARVTLGAGISRTEIERLLPDHIVTEDETIFDDSAGALRRRRTRRIGRLVLDQSMLPVEASFANALILAEAAARFGIGRLPWSRAQAQLRDRVGFLRQAGGDWPDLADTVLATQVSEWLAPFLLGRARLAEIDTALLGEALDVLLPFAQRQRIDREAPTHFTAPTGNVHAIRYEGEGAPLLSIRVQELFGLKEHPRIADGRLPLTLELLSPAHRSIQITRDLPGFWKGSWAEVRADMRGRYPKHAWPDDPANAAPTARAKPRGT